MNYADLFRITLPETALEIAALAVLVVDLSFCASLRCVSAPQRLPRWAWWDARRHSYSYW